MKTFEEAYQEAIKENGCAAGETFARSIFKAGADNLIDQASANGQKKYQQGIDYMKQKAIKAFKDNCQNPKDNQPKKKTYYEIWEEFQVGLIRLKCIEQKEDVLEKCRGCFFDNIMFCDKIAGHCHANTRLDSKDVIFVRVKEQVPKENIVEEAKNEYEGIDLEGFVNHLNDLIIWYGIDKHVGIPAESLTNHIIGSINELIDILNIKRIEENIPEKLPYKKQSENNSPVT